jgi:hypothetical protein
MGIEMQMLVPILDIKIEMGQAAHYLEIAKQRICAIALQRLLSVIFNEQVIN